MYILETTIALHTLSLLDLPAASGALEYKLKGDVTLFVAMYGTERLEPFWLTIADLCNVLYDMQRQPTNTPQTDPRAELEALRIATKGRVRA